MRPFPDDDALAEIPTESDPAAGPIQTPALVQAADGAQLDRSLLRALAWTGGVRWSVQIFTWVSTLVIARLLSPDDYGVMTMASVYVTIVTLLTEFGIGTTIVTLRELSPRHLAQLNGLALGLGVAAMLISLVAAQPLAAFYHSDALVPVVSVMGISFVLAGMRAVPTALLQRALRFPRLAVIDGATALVQTVVTLTLAVGGLRYWALVGGVIAGAITTTGLVLHSAPRTPVLRPRRDELRGALPFTFDTILGRLCWYAYQNGDFVVAGRRLSDAATGAYSYAWALASAPLEKIASLATQVTPSFLAEVQGDRGKLARYFLAMTEAIALSTFPLSVGLALTARDLVPVALGAQWLPAIGPLQVIAAYAGARAVTPFANQVLVALRDTRYGFWLNAVAALVLPIGFVVGSRWGTVGIAMTWVVLHPLVVIVPLLRRVTRKLEMPLADWWRAIWPALSSTLVMTLVVLSVQEALTGVPAPARLAAAVGTGALAYGGSLLVFHREKVERLRRAVAAMRR